jgi:hypothetical protein
VILEVRAPEGFTVLEAAIPDDLWDGITTGRYAEIIFPAEHIANPRLIIIKMVPR